jgi:hypothetical protein
MRDFAAAFVALQDAWNLADYDPQAAFSHSETIGFVEAAELAVQAFDRAAPDEQADVLALMLVTSRA